MKQNDLMPSSGRKLPLITCNLNKQPKITGWPNMEENQFRDLPSVCTPGETVGILCGSKSGVIVFDLDRKHGKDGVAEWERRFGPLPATATVRTPSGGLHLYFLDTGAINGCSVDFLNLKGIDIRAGDKGFVLMPPSPGYDWLTSPETEILPVPTAVLEAYQEQESQNAGNCLEMSCAVQAAGTEAETSTPHGRQILDRECRKLANTSEGARNVALNRSAFQVGKLVKAGEVQFEEACHYLITAARSTGLPDEEICRTLESGLEAGTTVGRTQSPRYTQQAFAEMIDNRTQGELLFLSRRRQWAQYQDGIWKRGVPSGDDIVLKIIMRIAKEIGTALVSCDDDRGRRWRQQCHSASYQAGAIKQLKAMKSCNQAFDQRGLICFQNGAYDPESQSFVLPDPAFYCSRHMGVEPDFGKALDEGAPRFKRFLEQITQGDEELQRYIQCLLGYCMTRDQVDPALFVWYGHGANGKTVLANVFRAVLGGCERGYCAELSQDDITMTSSERIRENLAGLESARVAFCPETEGGRYLKESLIKQITGGEVLTVEMKFGHSYTIRPCAKVVIYTNKPLRISGSDHGIWRRIAQVPFNYTVPDEDRNPDMLKVEYWQDELPVITAWGLEGLQMFLDAGKRMPACRAVEDTTQEYRMEEDHVGRFINERLNTTVGTNTRAKQVHEIYKVWAVSEEIEKPFNLRGFYRALSEHGLTLVEIRKVKHIIGEIQGG